MNEGAKQVRHCTNNRASLARFLSAVADLKTMYGSPDVMDHAGAEHFYGRVTIVAVATGILGPVLTPRDIANLMLMVTDVLNGEFDAYADCSEDDAAMTPIQTVAA